MKNTYQLEVRAQCPVNPADTDLYTFTIESETLIEVEKIVARSTNVILFHTH
jgi:hypothetical protein